MVKDPTATKQKTTKEATVETKVKTTRKPAKPSNAKVAKAAEPVELTNVEPKKKRHGWIIGLVIAAILAIGGAVLWFFVWYSNPNQVAYDAINNLFKSENVGIEGGISIINPDEDDAIKMVLISFDSSSNYLPNSSSAKVQFVFNPDLVEGDPHVLIEVNNIVMSDGVIYLQIGGIMDSINSLDLDEDTRSSIEVFLEAIELIDNEWWQVSIPDLLETMEMPEQQADAVVGVYQCAMQAMDGSFSDEMATIYKQNQFVEVKSSKWLGPDAESFAGEIASGHKAYELTVNKAKLASFVNQIPETSAAEEFFACYNKTAKKYGGATISVDDFDEISEDDVEWPEAEDLRIFLEISQWDHKLRRIQVYAYDEGEAVGGGEIMLKYDAVTVTAPESYRPVTDLFEELVELLGQFFAGSLEDIEEI